MRRSPNATSTPTTFLLIESVNHFQTHSVKELKSLTLCLNHVWSAVLMDGTLKPTESVPDAMKTARLVLVPMKTNV